MTRLGEYLDKKSVNKAEIARKTGLNKTRITELTTLERAKLRADELYLIALAIDVDPCEILNEVCGHLKIQK
ncbi:MAG: helix-turn-helix transcriptional regulator [Bacteroidota bacterium]